MIQWILACSLVELSCINLKGFFYSYAQSCSLCDGRTSFCTRYLSSENSAHSYLCFGLALLHSLSYFFFFYECHSTALCAVFYSISSNIDEVLSINPSANVGDFNVHYKDWLSYSAGANRPCELCYNCSISNNLTQILTVLFFWISFL